MNLSNRAKARRAGLLTTSPASLMRCLPIPCLRWCPMRSQHLDMDHYEEMMAVEEKEREEIRRKK
jgi:hypothetical protein